MGKTGSHSCPKHKHLWKEDDRSRFRALIPCRTHSSATGTESVVLKFWPSQALRKPTTRHGTQHGTSGTIHTLMTQIVYTWSFDVFSNPSL